MGLEPENSADVIRERVAEPLGVGLEAAANAIHEIANATMAAAVRVVTVQRGLDPRNFAVVAFGGAGPMHAARVAEEFDISTVIIPPSCGVGSAVGLLGTDLSTDRVLTRLCHENDIDGGRSMTPSPSSRRSRPVISAWSLPHRLPESSDPSTCGWPVRHTN